MNDELVAAILTAGAIARTGSSDSRSLVARYRQVLAELRKPEAESGEAPQTEFSDMNQQAIDARAAEIYGTVKSGSF